MIRAHRFALALIVLVASVIFLPALIKGEVFIVRDHLDYFQPLRWFTAEELKEGRLPLWNPYSASGEPWLANPQTGVFYPPTWLFLVLPFPAAYMGFLLLHLIILGWGAYLLFARTASQGAAMVGAVAVMFCGPTLSLLDINNNLATLAWLPLVLWCACERAWRRGAVALALAFLGGEPFFAGVAAVLFAIVAARSIKVVAFAGLGALGLTAIQLFPFLEAIRNSDRATGGLSPELILRESMPLGDWLRLAIPPSFGSQGQQFIPIVYTGMFVGALAIAGLLSIRKRHVAGWLALLVIAILIGAGPSFLANLPLTLFRYPARMVPLGALAIAALAVAGWDRIRPANKRWADLLLILVVIIDLLPRVQPLLETAPFRRDVVPYLRELGRDYKFFALGEPAPAERTFWISGYLNLYDRRFDASTAAPFENEAYRRFYFDTLASADLERVAFLSAGFILAPAHRQLHMPAIARAGNVMVYRNTRAWPFARLVADRSIIPAQCEIDTRSVKITVDAQSPGEVVLAQQMAPGWTVTVNGTPREPVAVRGIFRGVEVEKGRHEIVWSYRPRTLIAGAIVTLITALVISISVVVKGR
jgi:Bacterial membrane protein YfhO